MRMEPLAGKNLSKRLCLVRLLDQKSKRIIPLQNQIRTAVPVQPTNRLKGEFQVVRSRASVVDRVVPGPEDRGDLVQVVDLAQAGSVDLVDREWDREKLGS